ncbi:MAG TPA: glycosyltransferase [Chthoniobacterales bacterium]
MKLAVVIPWFGRDLKGGAEQQTWQIAARLAGRGHKLDVLTTCCRSHQDDWSTNYFMEGVFSEPEGFSIRRFRVNPRDRISFDRACGTLLSYDPAKLRPGVSPIGTDDADIFVNELIRSDELLNFLEENKEIYDWIIFLPYLYGPIIHGISIAADRAILQPCLHNEPYAYLAQVAHAFYKARRLFFNSEGEQELALKLFGPGIATKSVIVGEGVEIGHANGNDLPNDNAGERNFGRYVLYLGRKDAGKNVPLLIRAFKRFRAVRPNSDLQLMLAGIGSIELNGCNSVTDLGLVTEARKHELLRNCVALVQPSANESFSRVMMEAWLCGKPVAAQRSCLATAVAVERSSGGWLAETEEDWAALFTHLHRAPNEELAKFGDNGQRYANVMADWDKVIERYEAALALPKRQKRSDGKRRRIHHILPNLAFGDAISSLAILHRDYLRKEGFESHILVRHIDPRVAQEARVFEPELLEPTDAIIYHHSIGTDLTPYVVAHPGPKLLIYHNITPAEFFEPFRPDFADILRAGRTELAHLAQFFPYSAADSAYNAKELHASGFNDPQVLPIVVDPARWNFFPDTKLMDMLQDGSTNLLFVGRIAPNKKQHELVEAFSLYRSLDPTARLILVGPAEIHDPYAAHVEATIRRLGLEPYVLITGSVAEAELAAYYRTCDLYWSMSEHEGFGVPLIESMWFDIPVLAKANSAIPETLGEAALMFRLTSVQREWQLWQVFS